MGETENIFSRVSGRLGGTIGLNMQFLNGGKQADPFAIRSVKIYRSSVSDENIIVEIPFLYPGDPDYPLPAQRVLDSDGDPIPGRYILNWDVPESGIPSPDIFFDVWEFIGSDCVSGSEGDAGTESGGVTDIDPCLDDPDNIISQCGKFWLLPDAWYADDGLEIPDLKFEALNTKLYQPEIKTIQVGLMPVPLYDYNYNLVAPMIPYLNAKISLWTQNHELLIDEEEMNIGIRQGSYRTNPFVLQYKFNTTVIESTGCPLLKGTYKYRVSIEFPNGESRVSPDFYLQIS